MTTIIPETNQGMPPAITPVAARVVSLVADGIASGAEFLRAAIAAPLLTYHLWWEAANGAAETPPSPTIAQLRRYARLAECFVVEGTVVAFESVLPGAVSGLLAPGSHAGDPLRRAVVEWLRTGMGFGEWAAMAHLLEQRFDPRDFDDVYGPFRLAVIGTTGTTG